MKTVIIVQARMTSTRLPGKILKKVCDVPLLEYMVQSLRNVKNADDIVIATTVNNTDDTVAEFCKARNIKYYRGSEHHVLERYYCAAKKNNADIVVRMTSDCPLMDSAVTEQIIEFFHTHKEEYDYVSNTVERTYPRGLDTEIFWFSDLEKAYKNAVDESETEHVTAYFYNRPDEFRIGQIKNTEDHSDYRLTVDTPEDLSLIEKIITFIKENKLSFSLNSYVKILTDHPEWKNINAHIEQKKI